MKISALIKLLELSIHNDRDREIAVYNRDGDRMNYPKCVKTSYNGQFVYISDSGKRLREKTVDIIPKTCIL